MKLVKDFSGYLFESSSIGPSDLIILSNEKTIIPRTVEQEDTPHFKPNGLWYGIGTAWIYWVEANMPAWRKRYTHKMELDYSKVLRLGIDMSVKEFEEKYGSKETMRSGQIAEIFWLDVEKDGWYGIEIIKPRGGLGNWKGTWDVSSGCIWDKRAIKGIERVETL